MKKPIVLLVAIVFMSCTQKSPQTEPQAMKQKPSPQVTVPDFDPKSAFAFLTAQTDFGPRNPGSAGHANCLSYLHEQLQQVADAVNLQQFVQQGYDDEVLKLTNVIASFNSAATKRVLLIAHWDTRPRADQEKDPKKQSLPILGANDAASGVAVLLELGRLMKASPPPVGVDLLFVDGEDYGKESDTQYYLLGAKYFAKNMPPGYAPAFGILLDMVGDKQLKLMKEANSRQGAPDIVEMVWSTAQELGVQQFANEPMGAVIDDHLPFLQAGIPTIDLIDFAYPDSSNRYWHTTEDTPDKCGGESLEAVGRVLLHVIYRKAG